MTEMTPSRRFKRAGDAFVSLQVLDQGQGLNSHQESLERVLELIDGCWIFVVVNREGRGEAETESKKRKKEERKTETNYAASPLRKCRKAAIHPYACAYISVCPGIHMAGRMI
jgi:hypothetical protein